MYQIFKHLNYVSDIHLTTTHNDLVVAASCQVIANSLTLSDVEASSVKLWRKIVDVGLKHRTTSVQEATADATCVINNLMNPSADVLR